MKSAIGIVLIVFGLLAGASAASMNTRPEAQKLPPAERLGQSIGGALVSLVLVGGGFLLARSGRKKPAPDERRTDAPRPARTGETRLKCVHCGAIHTVSSPPAECDWCHREWSGREVTGG